MLRVRRAQMEALSRRVRARFVDTMARYLEAHFPESVAGMSRANLWAWVDRVVAKAERYGVTLEPDAAQLLLALMALGESADEDASRPWVREALTARGLEGGGKVRRLLRAALEHGAPGIEDVVVVEAFRDVLEDGPREADGFDEGKASGGDASFEEAAGA